MVDRHLLGDVGIAILLALPTVAFSRPQAPVPESSVHAAPHVEQAALAERTASERRYTLQS